MEDTSREGEVSWVVCGERTGGSFVGKEHGNDNKTPRADSSPAAGFTVWISAEGTRMEMRPWRSEERTKCWPLQGVAPER